MLNELGRHFDQGNLTMFLEDPEVEPTNNIAERMLRPAIVARKVSQCSKTERGANAYAAFESVPHSFINRLRGGLHHGTNGRAFESVPHSFINRGKNPKKIVAGSDSVRRRRKES